MMLNPNVLYLQSTPMTEPLLFGLTLLAVAATAQWLDESPHAEADGRGMCACRRMPDAIRGLGR